MRVPTHGDRLYSERLKVAGNNSELHSSKRYVHYTIFFSCTFSASQRVNVLRTGLRAMWFREKQQTRCVLARARAFHDKCMYDEEETQTNHLHGAKYICLIQVSIHVFQRLSSKLFTVPSATTFQFQFIWDVDVCQVQYFPPQTTYGVARGPPIEN